MNKTKIFSLIGFKILLLMVLTSFLLTSCGKKEESSGSSETEKKEESSGELEKITEGTPVHYEMQATGDMKGTWDVWAEGKKAYVKMNYEAAGQKLNSEMWMNNDMIYTVTDMGGKKMGMKMNPKEWATNNEKKKDFNPMSFKDGCRDCEKIGEEEVIGKKCDIYQDKNGIKYSVYEGKIPLKIVMPKTTLQATKLEVNAKINESMFEPPKDVEFIEMDKMMEGLKDMKNPKNLEKMKEGLKDMEKGLKNYTK
jgi:hypothetical protein